jgi:hypothetical protein
MGIENGFGRWPVQIASISASWISLGAMDRSDAMSSSDQTLSLRLPD